jgi:glycosyltransferase involved in cell wall biosynthesis
VTAPLTSTLLLPMLNEIEAAQVIVPQIRKDWVDEIIVIDGGSTDGTVEYVKSQGLRVHTQSARGYGEGMLQGLKLASGDIVVEFTPDGNALPDDIPRIVAKMQEGYDLVVGSRYLGSTKSDDDDWLTARGNWLFTAIVNLLFRAHYTDVLVGFRAFRREEALKLKLDTPGLSWPCQSSIRFARAGLKVTEIPAREPARIGGVRKMRPFKTGLEICRLIVRDFLTFWPGREEKSWR